MSVRKADLVHVSRVTSGLYLFRIGNLTTEFAVYVPANDGGRLWLYDATSKPIEDPRVTAALERAVRANH